MPGDPTLTARDRGDARPLPSVELEPDAPFGRYVIRDKLGAGGMGVVYAAWDAELDRDVALKIIRPIGNLDAKHARLRREARAMARLSHPHVVPVFDIGTHHGQLFIAMELVRGTSLRGWVARQPTRRELAARDRATEPASGVSVSARDVSGDTAGDTPASPPAPAPDWRDVVRVFVQAGRGLIAAHDAGVLHRDFKPDNVLVGRGGVARITDFGLARELAELDGPDELEPSDYGPRDQPLALSVVTASGVCSGTPAYMAPELVRGAVGDAQTDQFAFCVSLFEVLYGERPFRSVPAEDRTLYDDILAGRVARPATDRAVPGWLHAIVVRGLAAEPDARWPSMAELLGALEDGLGRRRRGAIAGVAALAALGLGALLAARAAPAAAPGCLASARAGDVAVALVACKDEYARTRDPETGAVLASTLVAARDPHDAAQLANELLATPARGAALYTLGNLAADAGRRDEARRAYGLARDAHCETRARDCAADWLALGRVGRDQLEQLDALDRAASYARVARDRQTEGYIAIASALPLSELGARTGTERALDRAAQLLTGPGDRRQLAITRADALQNLGDHGRAVDALREAIALGAPGSTQRALSLRLNLAYSLAELGQLDQARAALAEADALDPGDRARADRLTVAARLELRAHDPSRATALIDRALAATEPGDDGDAIERDALAAEIALAAARFDVAERHARRAIARAEDPPGLAPAALRGWLVTEHRARYELLFASVAERGDAAGAWRVLADIRDRDAGTAALFDDHGASRLAEPGGVAIAEVAQRWAPAPAPAIARDDVALILAAGVVWRLTEHPPGLARLGAAADLPAQLGVAAPLRPVIRPARLAELPELHAKE